MEIAGLLGQKCILFIVLGFEYSKLLLKYFHIFIFCSTRAFQRYIDNDNPTAVSDMASENIFTASDFWTDRTVLNVVEFNMLHRIMGPLATDLTALGASELFNLDLNHCMLVL